MSVGIYLTHKPIGPTSFSLVQQFTKTIPLAPGRRPPRLCHGGTLDPFASGLLILLLEPATRLFDYLHDIPKVYDATIAWGVETDNGDPTGAVTSTGDPSQLKESQLNQALATFIGWQDQIPHATSSKRIGGERAYVKAHRGETVVMPPARVYLHEAHWLTHDLPRQSRLLLTARGGYYVRALVRDLGRMLGCGAHVSQLHRQSIGPWPDPGPDQTLEIHGRDALPWLASRDLSDQEVGDLHHGRDIGLRNLIPGSWPLPPGFPAPRPLVRGFHHDKFRFLLEERNQRLAAVCTLRTGI